MCVCMFKEQHRLKYWGFLQTVKVEIQNFFHVPIMYRKNLKDTKLLFLKSCCILIKPFLEISLYLNRKTTRNGRVLKPTLCHFATLNLSCQIWFQLSIYKAICSVCGEWDLWGPHWEQLWKWGIWHHCGLQNTCVDCFCHWSRCLAKYHIPWNVKVIHQTPQQGWNVWKCFVNSKTTLK